MGASPRVVLDPELLSGQEPAIEGTGIPIRAVLGLTALGRSHDEILEWSRSNPYGEARRPLDADDIRAAFAYAAKLAESRRLAPPVRAGFSQSTHVLGDVSVDELEARAPAVLAKLATGVPGAEVGGEDAEALTKLVRAVAAYAAKLVSDQHAHEHSQSLGKDSFVGSLLMEDDRRLLEDFFAYRRALGGPHNLSPDRLLERWTRLVQAVENGYGDVYDEYANDIDGRDVLEDARSMVSPPSAEALLKVIAPLDQRFYAATHPITRALYPANGWKPLRWWWYRVPRQPGRALRKHLEHIGVR